MELSGRIQELFSFEHYRIGFDESSSFRFSLSLAEFRHIYVFRVVVHTLNCW